MMDYIIRRNLWIIFSCSLVVTLLSACSSNNESATVSPLNLPRMINIGGANVDIVNDSPQVASLSIQPAAFDDGTTDYSTDPVAEYNLNETGFGLDIINVLLCYIDEFSATSKVNQGLFKASILQNLCVPQLSEPVTLNFYVNSYRKDNSSPHVIQLWVEYPDYVNPEKSGRAVAEFVIHEAVSSNSPYGFFDFYDFEYDDISEVDTPEWQLRSKINIRILKNSLDLPRLEMSFIHNDIQFLSEMYSIMQGTSANFINGKSQWKNIGINNDTNFTNTNEIGSKFDENFLNQVDRIDGVVGNNECKSRKDTLAYVRNYNIYDAVSGQRLEAQVPPLIFEYTHDAANDRNNKDFNDPASNHNSLFTLNYYGPGSLYGFGYNTDLHMSQVNLEDGILLENSTGNFVTKAVEIGFLPKPASNTTDCGTLDVSTIFEDSDLDLDALPSIQAPSISINNWPNL